MTSTYPRLERDGSTYSRGKWT